MHAKPNGFLSKICMPSRRENSSHVSFRTNAIFLAILLYYGSHKRLMFYQSRGCLYQRGGRLLMSRPFAKSQLTIVLYHREREKEGDC